MLRERHFRWHPASRVHGERRLSIRTNGSPSGTCKINTLTIAGSSNSWTGAIHLTDNDLIIEDATTHANSLATLRNEVSFGSGHVVGIFSSTLPANESLIVLDNAVAGLATFGGVPVDSNSILVGPELLGDANVDGMVSSSDFIMLATHFGATGQNWMTGDSNGDGVVNALDFNAIASNFGDQLTASPALASVVPEPVSLLLLITGAGPYASSSASRVDAKTVFPGVSHRHEEATLHRRHRLSVCHPGDCAMLCRPTEHHPLAIGQSAPDFKLPGVDGKTYSLADFTKAHVLAIVFTCNHCPTAQAYEDRLIQLQRDYQDRGVAIVAICANDPKALRLDELDFSDLTDSLDDMKIRPKIRASISHISTTATPNPLRLRMGRWSRLTSLSSIRPASCAMRAESTTLRSAKSLRPMPATPLMPCWPKNPSRLKPRGFLVVPRNGPKSANALDSLKKWDAEPVTLDTIDTPAIATLARNATKKLLLVNLWATTCAPCVEELPELVTMNRMYRDRDFEFVSISIDDPDQKAQAFRGSPASTSQRRTICSTPPIATSSPMPLDPKWAGPIPYTLLIAPGGQIIYRHDRADRAIGG